MRRGLEFRFVSHMDDVLEHACCPRRARPIHAPCAVPLAEEALVAWLRQRTGGAGSRIGDDAALVKLSGDFAITIDSQEAGVHFPLHLPPEVIARRALAVNLSDLAACGAEPRLAFLALATPAGFPHRRFLGAFTQACRDAGVELAGGDLSRSDRVRATVCLIGKRQRRGVGFADLSGGRETWCGSVEPWGKAPPAAGRSSAGRAGSTLARNCRLIGGSSRESRGQHARRSAGTSSRELSSSWGGGWRAAHAPPRSTCPTVWRRISAA